MQCPVPHTKDAVLPPGHPHRPEIALASPSALGGNSAAGPSSIAGPSRPALRKLLHDSGSVDGVRPDTVDEWPLPEDLDFSRPVSELLRKGTSRAHATAEHSDGAVALTNGQLELQEYIRWLAVIWRVYDVLEKALDKHADNAVLSPTYSPGKLARAPEVAKDITFLLRRLPSSITKESRNPLALAPHVTAPPFPLPPFLAEVFVHTPPELEVYLQHIEDLAANSVLAPRLLAHAYVRYLGDLSGGQVIGARIRKAYGLAGLDGRRFYNFELEGDTVAAEAGEETVGERKKKLNDVKAWYRTGMDEGAGEDAKLKAALVKEANVAFLLNTHLFTLITPPPAVKPRYYERLATENERRTRLAGPGPTLAEKAMRVGYMLAAVFVVLFAMQLLAPILEPYARPAYDAYVAPVINNTLVPFYNNKFVPWWDSVAPMLHRQMAAQSRRMI